VEVVDMKLNKVVEMIRGPKNTEVRLTVIPNDAPDPSQRNWSRWCATKSSSKSKRPRLPH